MPGRFLVLPLVVGACSHAAPARAAMIECRVAASAEAIPDVSEVEACALVRGRLLAALGDTRGSVVQITLDLSRRGSAIARISETRDGVSSDYPEIAVDVMDRMLSRGDLARLGDAIAGALAAAGERRAR